MSRQRGKKRKDESDYDAERDELVSDLGKVPGTALVVQLRRYNKEDGEKGDLRCAVYRLVGQKGKRIKVCRLPVADAKALGVFLGAARLEEGG